MADSVKRLSWWARVKFFFGVGNWRVVYPCGSRSRPMCARVAANYRSMFGGRVEPTKAPILDWGLRR